MINISATIKDVAKYTGLSIATISKYINGGNVLEENRIKIKEAIEKLDFKVNVLARGLKTNKTMLVGIIVPSFVKIFCMTIISSIENVLLQYGYSPLICDYRDDKELEKIKINFLLEKSVDGIIIMPTGEDEDLIKDLVSDNKLPVVIIDRAFKEMLCDTILVDNMNAAYNAVEKLITYGHRRIGIISGPKEVYTAFERLNGYERVFQDYSMIVDKELIKQGDFTVDGGYRALVELMELKNPPTAVFVTNYEMTLGAVVAINEKNISIPDELSIIGFDGFEITKVVKPSLHLINQPLEEIGETAAKLIIKRIKDDYSNFPTMYRLKTEMYEGESIKKLN